ncbi:MAG: hypothetical protein PHU06_13120 [Gallionella sp.]|nr:hypothetical protein [Gallionella sp.]MDD4959626.1 hypothetical protein [Gallionella sp.]
MSTPTPPDTDTTLPTPIETQAAQYALRTDVDMDSQMRARELDDDPTQIRDLFLREVNSMIRYTMSAGKKMPANVFAVAEAFSAEHLQREKEKQAGGYVFDRTTALDITQLSDVHDLLSAAIAPATPRAILLLDPVFTPKHRFNWISTVPLIRRLMLLSCLSLIGFVCIALSPFISTDGGNIFISHGTELLVNLLFFVFAAALGASFSALFQANEYIVTGVFDPKFDASYWIRIQVGIIAGLILASLIPFEYDTLNGLGKPTLALLGGFSASLVHRILNLFVGALEGVVKKMGATLLDNPQENARKEAEAQKAIETMVQTSVDAAIQKQSNAG